MDVKAVVRQMTLAEKAGMCSGSDMWRLKGVERLGIPSVMVTDGPHGLRKQAGSSDHLGLNDSVVSVCFPTAAALASTFDRALVREVGQALGDECQAEDVAVILGPGANIKRSPLCGRNFEYFSEDPYLTGEMAKSHIAGVQSKGVGTSLKHFAVNNQETRRMTVDARVDERTLREIYLAGFEKAVTEAKPWTVMCSYNKINGTYGCENPHTLTEILRDAWGFEGYVMTDWGAMNDKIASIKAGLELQMPGGDPAVDKKLADAVKNGTLDEAVLDRACERILSITMRYVENRKPETKFDHAAHHALARRVEAEGCVLLKNGGALPLCENAKVAVIGKFAAEPSFQGGGSSHINTWKLETALDAFKAFEGEVVYAQGYVTDKDETDLALLDEASKAAAAADVAVVFAGMPARFESEGFDRKHLELPECQNQLISIVADAQPNTVVVLHNSSAVSMPWLKKVSAVIEAYLGGEAVGGAIYDVLTGTVNPSGKLAETFPNRIEDTPAYLNFPGYEDVVEYREGLYVGYRYYDARKMDVLFPFGHGLSYTTFEYSNLAVDRTEITDAECVTVTCKITNTGKRFGKEAAQLYVTRKTDGVPRAVRELKGFEKVALEPGETKKVSFTLGKRAFAYFNVDLNIWCVEEGDYGIEIGASSRAIRLEGAVHVRPEKVHYKPFTLNSTLGDLMKNPVAAPVVMSLLKAAFPMPEDGAPMLGMEGGLLEMLGSAPLRAMIGFSQGAFSEQQAQDMLDGINAGLA